MNLLFALTALTVAAVAALPGALIVIPVWIRVVRRRNTMCCRGRELAEPFLAEVLLDGVSVAVLTNKEFVEMFWRRYKITPVNSGAADILADDRLWNEGRFTFRDPKSGMVCHAAFAGFPPCVQNGHVILRGLYFAERNGD